MSEKQVLYVTCASLALTACIFHIEDSAECSLEPETTKKKCSFIGCKWFEQHILSVYQDLYEDYQEHFGHEEQNTPTKTKVIHIFTDGACSGNPGPGGWGAVIKTPSREYELSGGESPTTNNRMELKAAIEALESLPEPSTVTLTTDSKYVMQGIQSWIKAWKKNGWKTASKQPVKNADLWKRLDEVSKLHEIEWRWVKGHNGHPENERCDELARNAI